MSSKFRHAHPRRNRTSPPPCSTASAGPDSPLFLPPPLRAAKPPFANAVNTVPQTLRANTRHCIVRATEGSSRPHVLPELLFRRARFHSAFLASAKRGAFFYASNLIPRIS